MTPRSHLLEPVLVATGAGLVLGLTVPPVKGLAVLGDPASLVLVAAVALALGLAGTGVGAVLGRTGRARRRLHDAAYRTLRIARWRLGPVARGIRRPVLVTVAVLATVIGLGIAGHALVPNFERLLRPSASCTLGEGHYQDFVERRADAAHQHTLETFSR